MAVSQETQDKKDHSCKVHHSLMEGKQIMGCQSNDSVQRRRHIQEPPPSEDWALGNVTSVFFGKPLENWSNFLVSVITFSNLNYLDNSNNGKNIY